MSQRFCDECGSLNISPAISSKTGLPIGKWERCFCCNAVSRETNGSIEYFYRGDKN